jgi:hypothetical protein
VSQAALAGKCPDVISSHPPPQWPNRRGGRLESIRALLTCLAGFGGETWQERWIAGGFNDAGRPVSQISPGEPAAGPLTPALAALFALRVITPSLGAVRSNRFLGYPGIFRIAQADPALDGLFAAASELIGPDAIRREALTDVTVALTTEGVVLADLSSGRFLNYVLDSRNHVITVARHRRKRYRGHHAWELLCRAGHFPRDTPQAMKEAIREPRLTPAQLVARHDITSTGVRQLITDYLTVRCAEMDYSSLRTLASCLAGTFWKQVEALAPEQGDLNLPGELYERWRETVRWREDGKPRKEQDPLLLAVRSFYFDLATWALQEPAKWAVWVASCPVPQRELRGIARRRRQVSEEIAGRTRRRQPLLPRLVEQAEHDHALYSDLLAAGQATAPGQAVTAGGRTWIRVFSKADARREREHGRANVRLRDAGTGQVVHIDRQEERAFWEWAIVETLRHSGIRIEEYRTVTGGEWLEFEEHFDRRKVELGNCARPYGTGCQHEHACLRCPVLQVSPKMLPRLQEIEAGLLTRRARAGSEGWLGEIEGLDLTLTFLRDKRKRLERTTTTSLGMPVRKEHGPASHRGLPGVAGDDGGGNTR